MYFGLKLHAKLLRHLKKMFLNRIETLGLNYINYARVTRQRVCVWKMNVAQIQVCSLSQSLQDIACISDVPILLQGWCKDYSKIMRSIERAI